MEANEAPEKIYIPTILAANVVRYKEEGSIEYIRTDAFVERAADYIANNMRCDGYTLQTKVKFIRDFKKYMEG